MKTNDQKITTAIKNSKKFLEYANAQSFHDRLDTSTAILLGGDDKFWVPVCMADASRLIVAGYEEA